MKCSCRLEAFDDGQDEAGTGFTEVLESLPDSIFRAYDIRGVVGETLTEQIVYELGRAIGSEAYEQGEQTVIVARDGRHSGAAFSKALSEGLMASGRDVLDDRHGTDTGALFRHALSRQQDRRNDYR